jgi:hypothetical protein
MPDCQMSSRSYERSVRRHQPMCWPVICCFQIPPAAGLLSTPPSATLPHLCVCAPHPLWQTTANARATQFDEFDELAATRQDGGEGGTGANQARTLARMA